MMTRARDWTRTGTRWALLCLLIATPTLGSATDPPEGTLEPEAESVEEPRVVGEDWPERLQSVDDSLQAGRWDSAAATAEELAEEMVNALAMQAGADRILGTVSAYRALAEAGRGRRQEALWRWAMAQNLFTPFRQADLTVYGEAGELLTGNRLREIGDTVDGLHRISEVSERPVLAEAPPPVYPAVAEAQGEDGFVLVEVVVGPDGRLISPLVLESPGSPPLIYAALEAMADWRFEPAQKDGQPVAVMRTFRVVFELQDSQD